MIVRLPPRCERQIGTAQHPPHRILICPRSTEEGSTFCSIHQEPSTVAEAARLLDIHVHHLALALGIRDLLLTYRSGSPIMKT